MDKKTFTLPALSIVCITVLALLGIIRDLDPTIVYLCIVAIAGLGGYSVRTAIKTNSYAP